MPSTAVAPYSFRIKSKLSQMINEALHPPLPSYQPDHVPHHLLSITSLILHRLYFSNMLLSTVPEPAMLSPTSEPLHMMFSRLRIPSPACLTWQTHPMPSSHRWNAIPSVKLSFTHSDTLHIFFSFLTVLLTWWSYSTATVCRLISSLACSSLEITDWDFHSCIPGTQHRAWPTAGIQ